ncbi:MAG: tetratricopeptide repeat protein [Gemmatimonadota bacterium]
MQILKNDDGLPLLEAVRARYRARRYQEVVRMLGELPRAQLLEQPELGFMLADAARRVGGIADVVELCSVVVDAARAGGASRVLCDALNLHGVLLLEHGQAHAAERAWFELVAVATQADDPEYVARASNNLGVSAILSMRLEDALSAFQRSVAAYLRLGYSRGLAQAHQNLAIVFRELDHDDESHAHFQRALTWAFAADCMDDVARAEQELALLLLYSRRDVDAAQTSAQQALERFRELGEPAAIADAQRVLGMIILARGDRKEARKLLDAALDTARSQRLRLLEAETLTALAVIAPPASRYKLEQQAEQIFQEIDAVRWGEQLRKRLGALAA